MKNIITFLILALVMQLSFSQDTYEATIQGVNTFKFKNIDNSRELVKTHAKDKIRFAPSGTNKILIRIENGTEQGAVFGDTQGYLVSQIINPDTGVAFTSQEEALQWSADNLSFKTGSGATGTAATVNITSPNNTIDVSDDGTGNVELSVDIPNPAYIRIDLTGDFSFFNFAVVDDLLEGKTLVLLSDGLGSGTRTHTFGRFNDQQTATTTDGEDLLFSFNALGWNCLSCVESVIYNGATIISGTPTIAGMDLLTTRDGGSLLDHINSHATNNVSFNTDGTETWQELADIFGLNSVNLIKLGGNTTEPQVLTSLIQKGFYSVRRVGPNLEVKEISKPQVVGRLDEVTAKIHSVVIPSKGGLNDLTNQGHGLNPVLGEVTFDVNGDAVYRAGIRSKVNTNFKNATGTIYALVRYDAALDTDENVTVFTAQNTFLPLAASNSTTETIRLAGASNSIPFSINGVSGFAQRIDVLNALNTGEFVVLKIENIPSGEPVNIGDHQFNNNFDLIGSLKALIIIDGEVDDNDDTIINHAIQNGIDPLRLSRVSGITKEIANFEIENTNNGGGGTGQLFIDLDPIVITEPTILRFEHTSTVTNGSNYFTFGTTAGQETDGIGSLNNANIRLTPTKSSETFDIRVQPGTYHTRIGSGGGSASTSSSLKITEIKTGLIDVSELSNISADAENLLTLGSDGLPFYQAPQSETPVLWQSVDASLTASPGNLSGTTSGNINAWTDGTFADGLPSGEDGHFEFDMVLTGWTAGDAFQIGLSEDPSAENNQIDFSIHARATNSIWVTENHTINVFTGGSFTDGQVHHYEIRREAGEITYWQDDILLYTSLTNNNNELFIDTTWFNGQFDITNARIVPADANNAITITNSVVNGINIREYSDGFVEMWQLVNVDGVDSINLPITMLDIDACNIQITVQNDTTERTVQIGQNSTNSVLDIARIGNTDANFRWSVSGFKQ